MEAPEVVIALDLGLGDGTGEAFGCDLTEAYVIENQRVHDVSEVLVIKLGGTTIADQAQVLDEVAAVSRRRPVVLVHGGGKRISEWLERLGVPSKFEGGLRVTDAQSLEVAAAVLRGVVNSELVSGLRDLGVDAVGLSGVDGGLLIAERIPELGLVASVVGLRRDLLDAILVGGQVPVVAPLARDADGIVCNVNADDVAAGIAAGLGARQLVLLTDVDGVRDADGRKLDSLTVGRGGPPHRVRRHRRRHGAQDPGRARRARLGRRRGDHRRRLRPGRPRARPDRPDVRDAHHGHPRGGCGRGVMTATHPGCHAGAQAPPPAGHPRAHRVAAGRQPARGRRRAHRAGLRGHPGDRLARHHRARAA